MLRLISIGSLLLFCQLLSAQWTNVHRGYKTTMGSDSVGYSVVNLPISSNPYEYTINILRTTDNWLSLQSVNVPTALSSCAQCYIENLIATSDSVLYLYSSGQWFRSMDSGMTYSILPLPNNNIFNRFDLLKVMNDSAYVIDNFNKLIKYENNQVDTIYDLDTLYAIRDYDLFYSDQNHYLIGLRYNNSSSTPYLNQKLRILQFDRMNNNVQVVFNDSLGLFSRFDRISYLDSNIAFAMDSSSIYKSTNGGSNWQILSTHNLSTSYYFGWIFKALNSQTLITSVDSSKVYVSYDGGFNWIFEHQDLNPLREIELIDNNSVGINGNDFPGAVMQHTYLRKDFQLSTALEDTDNRAEAIPTLFPNPVDEGFVVQNSVLEACNFKIFNSSGKLIMEGVNNSNFWEVSSLESGIYFLLLIDGEHAERLKFVKL